MILQISIEKLIFSATLVTFLLGIIQWILSLWIKTRLEKSIQHEYDKQLEEYRFSISKREKIANIASFFSLWIKYRGHERKWLNDEDLIDYYKELTKMSFELALWVDDDNLLKDIMKRLKNEDGSENINNLLLKAKKIINENKQTELKAEDITLWPADVKFIEEGKK